MDSENEDRKVHSQVAPCSLGLAKLGMALCLLIGLPSYSGATGIYTGVSVGTNGTVYGWGITNLPGGTWYTHDNHVSSTLTSPNGRHASCGMNALDYARCDVSLPFDPNDTGNFIQVSTSSVFCSVMGWFVWQVVTQGQANLQPPTLSCASVTRGQSTTCTVTESPQIWNLSNWQFTDGTTHDVTVTEANRTAMTWTGVVVRSGTVRVTATGPDVRYPSSSLNVNVRNWHTDPASAGQVANGTFITLPVPPQPSGSDSGLGYFREITGDQGAQSSTIIAGGPNAGYAYWANQLSVSTLFQYEINPDLENSGSPFSQRQYGNCGFISWSNLLTQTRRHEYNSTTQSHHAFYANSIGSTSKNPGDFVEAMVGLPGADPNGLASATRSGLTARYQQIATESEVQPLGANYSEIGSFLGDINYAPYAPCP